MPWPLASQFSAMMQRPEVAFRDPELKRYAIEKDQFRQPRPWAGSFAVVYKGLPPNGGPPRAIRVFTSESPERRDRYDAISAYLKMRRVRSLVDFEYRDESVRASGSPEWYPLILMEWVQGDTLFKWVGTRSRAGDRKALAAAAARWLDLVDELEDAKIAHGDLQHANVMVQPDGRLRLVDYDCLCVPALVGRRNLEVGVEPYQHPERNQETLLSLELDRYSAMVIYVALKALAAEPALWKKHVEGPHHDKLLFRKEDFLVPESSLLLCDLRASPDQDVVDLTEQLWGLSRAPMADVGPLRQLSNPSLARIERLLTAGQWDEAVELLNRRGRFRDAPRHLRPLIEEAYKHVCRREQLAALLRIPRAETERNDRGLLMSWNEALFAGFEPAEKERPRFVEAMRRVKILNRLGEIVKEAGGRVTREGEAALVEAAAWLPPNYQYSLSTRVEKARNCLAAIRRVEATIVEEATEAEIAAAWREAVSLGCEGLVTDECRQRIELALQRAPVLAALEQIPEGLRPDDLDARVLAVWHDELLEGCAEADRWREACHRARARRAALEGLERAIRVGDEAEIVRLTQGPVLNDYPLPVAWSQPIAVARTRIATTEAMLAALGNRDAAAFVQAFDARLIRRYHVRFAPHEQLVCEWTRQEILPVERLALRPALARASLLCEDRAEGAYRVRWTWPQQRFADECILAVCRAEPMPGDDPRELDVYHRMALDRESWECGGGSRLVHTRPEWGGGFVVVWAMVDVGFRRLPSHPLVLGRLEAAPNGVARLWRGLGLFSRKRAKRPARDGATTPETPADGEAASLGVDPARREDDRP